MILQDNAAYNNQDNLQEIDRNFLNDVLDGLQSNPKKLKSKYFYDKTGDTLFQKIMAMPEYYLTRCELDIFKNKTVQLANIIMEDNTPFDLIELGAGDATKSTYLLQFLSALKSDFSYMPIDISGNILNVLQKKLKNEVHDLDVICLQGDYFEMLTKAAKLSARRKVVMFLGGNIGNMETNEAYAFCKELRNNLSAGDIVLMGFDLKKHPQTILNAYNDSTGITAAFNLNLLTRINNELDGDFDIRNFQHYQNYDPLTGSCRSYLVCLEDKDVHIDGNMLRFKKDEVIYMEVSQKFSPEDIRDIASANGFDIVGAVNDSKDWFTDALWIAK